MFELKELLKPYPQKGSLLLEINPCPKRLNAYTDLGFKVTALDMDLNNIETCKKFSSFHDLRYGSLLSSPFGHSELFNVITFFGVLSGMMPDEAKSFIYSVGSTLQEKGLALFTVPSDDYKPAWWDEAEEIQFGRIACSPPYTGEVFCRYDIDTIKKFMLDFIDLKIEECGSLKILKAVKF
ncbi:hypothetical protein JW890_03600 [candidate division WOR-3 bacterium]|nr:hypothetical protein [candidate division WOR-3 bacterium]